MTIQNRVDRETALPNPVVITETATLRPGQRNVKIDSSAGDAITVTLPDPTECVGAIFALSVISYSGAITISDGSKSRDFSAPTFNGADDGQCLYCDGEYWWAIATRT